MTTSNKPSATIVDESPSLLRAWWMNKNLRYDVAVSSIIMLLNIAAIVYMATHKIPLNDISIALLICFGMGYFMIGIGSCVLWFEAIEDVSKSEVAYVIGRISHTSSFCVFFVLLYRISPSLALRFGLPCLIWFVAAMFAPCCPFIWDCLCVEVQNIRNWWKHVNQPQQKVNQPQPKVNQPQQKVNQPQPKVFIV